MVKAGDYFVYAKGDEMTLGRVKRDAGDGKWFCWYHDGDTAACTSEKDMRELSNQYVIRKTSLGGDDARSTFGMDDIESHASALAAEADGLLERMISMRDSANGEEKRRLRRASNKMEDAVWRLGEVLDELEAM